jgi:cyclic-di-GMP-binding protein
MPTFDIVSKVDMQEVDNAMNSVKREIDQRYDFKGSKCAVSRDEEDNITILADNNYQLEQIQGMLKVHMTRRKIDAKALEFKKTEAASGNCLRQQVVIKQGIEGEVAKQVTKEIKNSKLKVQASIRGDEVRVDGKKRDDLQEAMALIRGLDLEVPVQFINFRD